MSVLEGDHFKGLSAGKLPYLVVICWGDCSEIADVNRLLESNVEAPTLPPSFAFACMLFCSCGQLAFGMYGWLFVLVLYRRSSTGDITGHGCLL